MPNNATIIKWHMYEKKEATINKIHAAIVWAIEYPSN